MRVLIGVLLGCFFASVPAVQAAQDARVVISDAPINAHPEDGAPVIETKKYGDILRISSDTKNGWYKTRTSGGGFGWINQRYVLPKQYESTLKAANLEMTEKAAHVAHDQKGKPFSVRLAFGPQFMAPLTLQQKIGRPRYKVLFGTALMGELEWRFANDNEGISLAFRAERFSGGGDSGSYHFSYSGTPLYLGGRYVIAGQPKRKHLTAGLYVGADFWHSVTVTHRLSTMPNSAELNGTALAALLAFEGRWPLNKWLALSGELGIRYERTKSTAFSNSFNGDGEHFRSSGQLDGPALAEVTPVLLFGAVASF